MNEEQLAIVRCYKRREPAEKLDIPETWLKRWVTARCVPHQRSGDPHAKQQRGVWFTAADILEIGRMLPELMTSRQAKAAACATLDIPSLGAPELISTELVDKWATIGLT
ncbi:hypothetical protein [Geodermatophilus sabuli]|uniref:MerR HTH family regulatory protein n=1 Tax=Geodermatophilus sabuli TaxID=1564158 RepID=A0A285E5R1_9ACTN|nr:hypothetical protein [Geodermatophilus sabuli]MBB3082722.1 hypothetical protein [Geodermatophilus sabuli]SNX94412.1 hypothetical protein SAMN06893097_101204 [Geodermatophilus sabuli]